MLDDHDFSKYEGMTTKQIHEYIDTFGSKNAVLVSEVLKDLGILPQDYNYQLEVFNKMIFKVHKVIRKGWDD